MAAGQAKIDFTMECYRMQFMVRRYFHGDVSEEDPTKFYNRRTDYFEPIAGFVPTWEDLRKFKWEVRNIRNRQGEEAQRPIDAKNILPKLNIPRGVKAKGFWKRKLEVTC